LLFTCCKGTFTSALKDNKSLRSHKTVDIKVFLIFFGSLKEGSGSVQIITGPDGPKLTTDKSYCVIRKWRSEI
jgi:hypothetical protein